MQRPRKRGRVYLDRPTPRLPPDVFAKRSPRASDDDDDEHPYSFSECEEEEHDIPDSEGYEEKEEEEEDDDGEEEDEDDEDNKEEEEDEHSEEHDKGGDVGETEDREENHEAAEIAEEEEEIEERMDGDDAIFQPIHNMRRKTGRHQISSSLRLQDKMTADADIAEEDQGSDPAQNRVLEWFLDVVARSKQKEGDSLVAYLQREVVGQLPSSLVRGLSEAITEKSCDMEEGGTESPQKKKKKKKANVHIAKRSRLPPRQIDIPALLDDMKTNLTRYTADLKHKELMDGLLANLKDLEKQEFIETFSGHLLLLRRLGQADLVANFITGRYLQHAFEGIAKRKTNRFEKFLNDHADGMSTRQARRLRSLWRNLGRYRLIPFCGLSQRMLDRASKQLATFLDDTKNRDHARFWRQDPRRYFANNNNGG